MNLEKTIRVSKKETWIKELENYNFSLFISSQWVESVSDKDAKSIYIDIIRKNSIVGKIAGLIVKGKFMQGDQLYFYSGPALKDDSVVDFKYCLEKIIKFGKQNRYSKISIRPYDQQVKELVKVKGYVHTHWFEYLIKFTDIQPKKLSYGFKQNVKKGRKIGGVYKISKNPDDVDVLFELLLETLGVRENTYGVEYDPIGIFNVNKKSLKKLMEFGIAKIHYAEVDGEIQSAQLNIEFNGRTYGFLMGSNVFAYRNGLPSFIDFNIIEGCKLSENTYYNLGGVISDEEGNAGIIKYKESMRGVRYDAFGYYSEYLTYPYKVLNPIIFLMRMLPSNKVFSWLRSIYGKLMNIR